MKLKRFMHFTGLILALISPTFANAQEDNIRLIINDPTIPKAPSNDCKAKICASLLKLFNEAESSIDFAFYGMRNQSALLNALKRAKDRGVVIRGIVDMGIDNKSYYSSTPDLLAAIPGIQTDYETDKATQRNQKPYNARYGRCQSPPGFLGPAQCLGYDLGNQCLISVHASRESLTFQGEIMHHKFAVVDGRYVWTGSTNMSDSGTGGYNANLVLVVDSTKIAERFVSEMDQMYMEKKFHRSKQRKYPKTHFKLSDGNKVDVRFTPQDQPIKHGIRPLIQKAKKSIDVAVFFLTHKHLTDDLIQAHRRGVKVRIIMDATGAKNGYTKQEILRAAGIPVKIESWGGKMHMKSAVIDDQILIGGSMNWTSAGDRTNDENTLIIWNRRLNKEYRKTFQKLWDSIPDKWLEGRPDPESRNSGSACFDKVDNDFDHKADKEDAGCSDSPPPLPALPPYLLVPKEEGHGLIKGIVAEDGRRLFYSPNNRHYSSKSVNTAGGDVWLCSESQAWDAGFKPARN